MKIKKRNENRVPNVKGKAAYIDWLFNDGGIKITRHNDGSLIFFISRPHDNDLSTTAAVGISFLIGGKNENNESIRNLELSENTFRGIKGNTVKYLIFKLYTLAINKKWDFSEMNEDLVEKWVEKYEPEITREIYDCSTVGEYMDFLKTVLEGIKKDLRIKQFDL